MLYEITQSTDNFVFTDGVSTPVPFGSQTSTTATIGSLASGGTYYFRVRAQNSGGVSTSYSSVITTVTIANIVIQSTGGTSSAGATTVTADPGVKITNSILSDGTTQQTLISTYTASISYGSGISIQITAGAQVTCVATADSLLMSSTQSVTISNAGVTIESTPGTLTVQSSADTLSVTLSTNSEQNVATTIPTTGNKTVSIGLSPAVGVELKTSIPPGGLSTNVKLRVKIPNSFPASALGLRGAISPFEGPIHFGASAGAPAFLNGLKLGLEITLDQSIQPAKEIPITVKYRDKDIGSVSPSLLTLARFDETLQKWIGLQTTLNAPAKSVSATTKHFSRFQLMAVTPATDVNDAAAYPNPLKIYEGDTEMTIVNLSPDASVKIYSVMGELVRDIKADATGTARWDAKNLYGMKVGSGIYFVLLKGSSDSKKVLRVAVER